MAMKISKFCCCCSLRRGTIIIALFILGYSVVLILLSIGNLHSIPTVEDDQSATFEENQKQLGDIFQRKEEQNVILKGGNFFTAVQSFLNILLLTGVLQEQRIPVIIWIMAYTVICGLGVLACVASFLLFTIDPILQVILGIYSGLHLYFLLVVWSFHKSLETGYNRKRNAADMYDTENCKMEGVPLEQPV